MAKRKIILASKSITRKRILEQVGVDFTVQASAFAEDMCAFKDPVKLVKFLALEKAKAVARGQKNAIIIGADTFAIFEGKFLGKPKDRKEAKIFLQKISGKEQRILSGFAIIDTKKKKIINDFGEAKVKFKKLTREEITAYLATGEPLKFASAYGAGDKGAFLIEKIEGDFYSVIGLPIVKVMSALRKLKAI
jgi:septum formation protein